MGRGRGGGEGVRTRDHLASTRTLLAWARLGIALLALGYAVDKEGLIEVLITGRASQTGQRAQGLAAASAGLVVLAAALVRFFRQRSRIESSLMRMSYRLDLLIAVAAALGGLLVLGVLVTTP